MGPGNLLTRSLGWLVRAATGTVRRKLVALVVICVAPAILSAMYRAHDTSNDFRNQIGERMDVVRETFNDELGDTLVALHQQLAWARSDPMLQQLVSDRDLVGLERFVARRTAGWPDMGLIVTDMQGHPLAWSRHLDRESVSVANLTRLLKQSIASNGSVPFDDPGAGMAVPLRWDRQPGYGLLEVETILGDGAPVGSLALVRPLDRGFLDHCAEHMGTDWAMSAHGEIFVQSARFPWELLTRPQRGPFAWDQGRQFALQQFHPEIPVAEGVELTVNAARDITPVAAESARDLLRSLGLLFGALAVALGCAVALSRRMSGALSRISVAARGLTLGQYEPIAEVETNDELQALAAALNQSMAGLRERDRLKERFGKYVTREVAAHILEAESAELRGETVPVTVFFADIRGFTTLSEKMPPKALLDFLNLYFSGMVESVMRHHGVVDKFIGDALMAVFGAPVPHPDDAIRAVRAALAMREKLTELNQLFSERGLPEIRFGIGMHSGTVVAGSMGHQDRMEYTVIGDPVNVASRLEGMTKELGVDIVLSEDTYSKVSDHVVAEPLRKIQVRGREAEVMVYKLVSLRDAASRAA